VFRVQVGSAALALVMLPIAFVDSMVTMGISLFVAGVAIAPTLIASMSATEQMVPGARLTEGIAIMHTGIAAGLAPGAALAGVVIDAHGASAAYFVAFGAGLVAALAGLALGSPPAGRTESVSAAPGAVIP
jgi:predicted MFS family arabinose efflux permease